jgi:hypothetical protein
MATGEIPPGMGWHDAIGWHRKSGVERDLDYDYVAPIQQSPVKKGVQCGECGMKFDYGTAYGYCCMNARCPTGWNGR